MDAQAEVDLEDEAILSHHNTITGTSRNAVISSLIASLKKWTL